MTIKEQIINRMEKAIKTRVPTGKTNKYGRPTYKQQITYGEIAERSGISYSTLRKWIVEDGRGISDRTLDKIASALDKVIILTDKI